MPNQTAQGGLAILADDVCDRCGAHCYVKILLPTGGMLGFCAHHGRVHAEAIAAQAVHVIDESSRLLEPSAAG